MEWYVVVAILAGIAFVCKNAVPIGVAFRRGRVQKPKCGCDCPACAYRQTLRKLFSDHLWWTRQVIESALAASPDLPFALARLMRNQKDIAAVISGASEPAPGVVYRQQVALWDQHINISVELVGALAKGEDATNLAAEWSANGEQIADSLWRLRPKAWTRQALRDMLAMHLSTTTAEVQARIAGDWRADVGAVDAVVDHMMVMADALASGFAHAE